MFTRIKIIATIALAAILAACGGGGGGGSAPSTPVAKTFAFSSAFETWMKSSHSYTFAISGSCTGSGADTYGAPIASNLFGATYSRTTVTTTIYSNCTGSGSNTNTGYYDKNFNTISVVSANGNYTERTVLNQRPATVKVGDTLQLFTVKTYSNSTKTSLINTGTLSITIEAESENAVIVNYIVQIYNANGTLFGSQQSRWRLTSTGDYGPVTDRNDVATGQYKIQTYN
jgi:hypothetical protein